MFKRVCCRKTLFIWDICKQVLWKTVKTQMKCCKSGISLSSTLLVKTYCTILFGNYNLWPWEIYKLHNRKFSQIIFNHSKIWKLLPKLAHYCSEKKSRNMRFSTWYAWPAKPQISLCIRAVWSEPLLVARIFY